MKNKWVRATLSWIVAALVIYFFAQAVSRNWEGIKNLDFSFNAYSLAAIILFTLAVLYSGFLWGKLLEKITDKKPSNKAAVEAQVVSWLLKYLPGQAGTYVSKLVWGKREGYSKEQITVAFAYENTFHAVASILFSLPVLILLFPDDLYGNLSTLSPLLLVVATLPLLNKKVFYKLFSIVSKKGKSLSEKNFLETASLSKFILSFMGPRLVNAVGFLFVAGSFLHITPEMYLPLGATYVLAGIVGILAVFVPSGIGVREAVIVLIAQNYFSIPEALALALLARLYATIADGLLAITYAAYLRKGEARA